LTELAAVLLVLAVMVIGAGINPPSMAARFRSGKRLVL